MKINWGHGLAFFTGVFMLFILSMVFYLNKQKMELVDEDYYEQGIQYQEIINQSRHAENLITVNAVLDEKGSGIALKPLINKGIIDCKLSFYRPSDKNKDFTAMCRLQDTALCVFHSPDLEKGAWKLRVSWTDTGGKHQIEKDLRFK